MSRLFIIRHGQASFGAADYDQLSPLGEEQSERLGGFLAARGIRIDRTYVGPNKRHQQTASGIASGLARAGIELGEAHTIEGLREFPAFELFHMHSQGPLDGRDLGANMAHSFEAICEAWMLGSIDSKELESAQQFEQRVSDAFRHICSALGEEKRNTLVVTSGGPTMIALKTVLGLDAKKACELLWVIANSSITELRYRRGQLFLSAFNHVSHLDAEHITYR